MPNEKWNDKYDAEWASEVATWPWKNEGDVLRMEGECPRCGHEMSREVTQAPHLVRGLKADLPDAALDEVEEITVTVRCNCKGSHAGRPKKVIDGCGKSAAFTLPL